MSRHIRPLGVARPIPATARLAIALAGRPCACKAPAWQVKSVVHTGQSSIVRYLKCRTCGRTGKLVMDV